MEPFFVFGLGPEASTDAIEKRYHTLISQYPPDRAPEIFSIISEAYTQLKNKHLRLRRWLEPLEPGGGEDARLEMINQWMQQVGSSRAPIDTWRQILRQAPMPSKQDENG